MTATTLDQIGEILSEIGTPSTFSARRARPVDDLHLEVKGLGRLDVPVSRKQAEQLCQIARPARYGQGEQTLLDRRVRDTWEIPKSRVKIDRRRWKRTLLPVLEQLGTELGIPAGRRLTADLHAMLVYAPGQFFLPHQDSEKTDEMVATLVVTLPSSFKGGAMVVEHRGESATYRGSKKYLSFVAFYADCRHEVRTVKEGFRVVLTYNLTLASDAATTSPAMISPGSVETKPATVDALAFGLREHFETPLPRWRDAPPREPPNRLVCLLDHEYTERGLGWQRLKGNDVVRSAALRAAAERYDCELVLALVEVHETWNCNGPGWDKPWYHRQRWRRGKDDEWHDDPPPPADDPPPADRPEGYELDDLLIEDITLTHWIDSSGAPAAAIVTCVDDEELCAATLSSDLKAYASEYTGYMGNDGNTMDRWYRRSAVVLWPRRRAFAVRAEASPAWALKTLRQRIRSGQVSEARAMATSLLSFWVSAVRNEKRRGFFDQVLRVAEGLEASALAASLLRPFRLEALTPGRAPAFAALVRRYGEDWTRSMLSDWASRRRFGKRDPLAWIGSLPRLCEALCAVEAQGQRCATLLLQDRWGSLREEIEQIVHLDSPSRRAEAAAVLAKPILDVVESAEIVGTDNLPFVPLRGNLRDEAVAFFCADENEPLIPCLVQVLRVVSRRAAPKKRAAPGLDAVRRHCIRRLKARLETPVRDTDDWSVDFPEDCRCELCVTLREFLSDAAKQQLEWPLAEHRRWHVHSRIDTHELPVHRTIRRTGQPHTLVLSKTTDLFEREAKERRSWQSDLDWLTRPRGHDS